MIYNYVYRLDDPITGEFYFGSRSSKVIPKLDNYMGSMKRWKPEDRSRLVKTIIRSDFKNRDSAYEYEDLLISLWIEDSLNRNYHRPKKGFTTFGLTSWNKGKNLSKETRNKISNYNKGKRHSEETKKKMSTSHKGKTLSEDTRKKISIRQIGEKHYFYGKRHSIETRKKMSNSHKGKFQSLITCPHCGKEGGNATMPRWHFKNCKKICL